MPESTELDTKKNQAVGQTVTLGRGHEAHSDQEDFEIPRAKLIQSVSEEAQSDKPVKVGSIINSITKKTLPDIFIPVLKYPNSYIQWNPRKKDDPNFDPAYDAGAMVFMSNDPNDARVLAGKGFGPNGEPPKVTKYLNFLAYFPGESWPVVISFAKTSFTAGRRLNSLTRLAGGDIFSNQFALKSVQREANGTKYYVLDVEPAGKAPDGDFKVAEKLWEDFKTRDVKVHQMNEDEPTHPATSDGKSEDWKE